MISFERQKDLLRCEDATCASELGGALGCDKIVIGQVGVIGAAYLVNLKVMNIQTIETEARVYETVEGEAEALVATIKSKM